MIKIALTMRIDEAEYHELRDCIAQDWHELLHSQKIQTVFIPNDPNKCTKYLEGVNALILTGGDNIILLNSSNDDDNPKAIRDVTEYTLLTYAIEKNIPILGICRGMQLINYYFEGSLKTIDGHVAKEHEVSITKENQNLFPEGILLVNSFHNHGIDKLGEELQIFAKATDGSIEGFKHKSKNITGIMWHPERNFSDTEAKKANEELILKFIS